MQKILQFYVLKTSRTNLLSVYINLNSKDTRNKIVLQVTAGFYNDKMLPPFGV